MVNNWVRVESWHKLASFYNWSMLTTLVLYFFRIDSNKTTFEESWDTIRLDDSSVRLAKGTRDVEKTIPSKNGKGDAQMAENPTNGLIDFGGFAVFLYVVGGLDFYYFIFPYIYIRGCSKLHSQYDDHIGGFWKLDMKSSRGVLK